MKVLFVTGGGPERASSRLRVFNLLPHLSDRGIQYDIIWPYDTQLPGPKFIRRGYFILRLLGKAFRCDILYLQKLLLPKSIILLLQKLATPIIFDLDDAIYTAPSWSTNIDQKKLERAWATFRVSKIVIAGSPEIEKYISEFNEQTEVFPASLPGKPYQDRSKVGREIDNDVTIGWIGNPENLRYLTTIENELEQILDQYTKACLTVITAGDLPEKPLFHRDDVEYRKWSLETQVDELNKTDICIRPLTDDKWTRSKGGFVSVIQPMALEIPVVVTPVGMLSDIVEHGQNGFHADDPSEWIEYLGRLINSPELRTEMGKRAYESVGEQRFWADQRAEDLVAVLRSVAESSDQTDKKGPIGWVHD